MTSTVEHIKKVELFDIEMPLVHPFRTSFGTKNNKNAIIVKTTDMEGKVGWGETTVQSDPGYCYETTETAWYVQTQYLLPMLRDHNSIQIKNLLDIWEPVRGHEFAKGGIEASLWHLSAEQQETNLGALYGSRKKKIPTGVSIGIQSSIDELLERINLFVKRGYQRIKIKIEPGWDIDIVKKVREQFEDILLMVDANSAYTLDDVDHLKKLDEFNLMMIEQPLSYNDVFAHIKLQDKLDTPVCLDESIHDPMGAKYALEFGACEIINIKPGRVGGYGNAIEIAQIGGSGSIWCGGMLETGIGRLHNIFLQARNEFSIPGDTSESNRYFSTDIIDPEVQVDRNGYISVPEGQGLGHEIKEDRIRKLAKRHISIDLN